MFKFLLIVILLTTAPFTNAIDQLDPYHLMSHIANQVFTRLKNKNSNAQHHYNYINSIVKEELLPYVHVKYIGAILLGRFYYDSTPIQRDAYFKALNLYIEHICNQSLALYNHQRYQVLQDTPLRDEHLVTIRVIITDDYHPPVRLDFQWRKNSILGKWQIYDLVVEGISIITSKQNEWTSTLRNNGVEGLTWYLNCTTSKPVILDRKNDN